MTKEDHSITDSPDPIDPQRTAQLVMDDQVQLLDSLRDAGALLSRTADAIATVRRHGGQIGCVRVAFADAEYAAITNTNKTAARIAAMGSSLGDESSTCGWQTPSPRAVLASSLEGGNDPDRSGW